MKRVLVVDDEFLVRLGLRTTMDWEAHGYEIVERPQTAGSLKCLMRQTRYFT